MGEVADRYIHIEPLFEDEEPAPIDLPHGEFPLQHVSPSALLLYAKCPEAFRRSYIKRMPRRTRSVMVGGTAVHGALETNALFKMDSGRDLSATEIMDAYDTAWTAAIDKEGGVKEIEWDGRPGAVKDAAATTLPTYHAEVSPMIEPIAAEQWIRIELAELPLRVVGRADLLARVETMGERILDYKVSGRLTTKMGPDNRFQGGVYSLAKDCPAQFHYLRSKGSPAFAVPWGPGNDLETKWGPDTRRAIILAISSMTHGILDTYQMLGPDTVWPTTGIGHPYACGFCDAKGDCPVWSNL